MRFMCVTCTGLILTVVGIKEILKALNNILEAAKTEHCCCSEILFQSNLGPADAFTDKSSSQIEHFISLK